MTEKITADCLAELPGISHGFFTRAGGVSDGLYASLNCGLGSRDDATLVSENRSRIAAALGAAPGSVITPHQVHSATAVIAERPWTRETMPKADAIVTRTRGLVIGILTADCAPVLLADPEAGVVAAAHAGWRGALGGVLAETVATMERLGARRGRIRAVVGPCINQPAYEVGPDFESTFVTAAAEHARFFERPHASSRPHFDLPRFVAETLAALELDTVEMQSLCTYEDESRFFSYRRATHRQEPDYGRQISAIVVI